MNNPNKFFFAKNIIFDLPISEDSKIVYFYLSSICNRGSSTVPCCAKIAQKCGLSEEMAKQALEILIRIGLLDCSIDQSQSKYTIFNEPKKNIQQKYREKDVSYILNQFF